MEIEGKWIYLKNHTLKNLDNMYKWSIDYELIEIELGNLNKRHNKDSFEKI